MKKMKKAGIFGHFAFHLELLNGQTVKTRIVTDEIERQLGKTEVAEYDTHGGMKALLRLPFQIFSAMRCCENLVMFPAHNGLRILPPLFLFYKHFFRSRKLHYAVIGGWLPEFLKKRKRLCGQLKRFDCIYVETHVMKHALEAQEFQNIVVMPNCKNLRILTEAELVYQPSEPFRVCTFSRVMKEKGIEDAIAAVKAVNEASGRTVYQLDIYGQVEEGQNGWFDGVMKNAPAYVQYRGTVPFDQSTEVLKNYFALLFPTHFFTEGIPGTVIDAYAAGVPVISSMWESFADVIDDGVTGIGYRFASEQDLTDLLSRIAANPRMILDLKQACIAKAEEFIPEKAVGILVQRL